MTASPMTPAQMEGMVIGPVSHHPDLDRIRAFVEATGDDTDRWDTAAPPGYAAVLLFAVAGEFLWDPRIAAYRRTLIHVDQQFTHPAPIRRDAEIAITGTVDRVRERAGAFFVTFLAEAEGGDGVVVESRSTFLMSDEAAAEAAGDSGEAPAETRAPVDPLTRQTVPLTGPLASAARSASRADLIRYSAATADFNPLHWDHAAAREAGLEGVVVHGLLMHAWLAQYAASYGEGPVPVATIKTRFRNALRPSVPASLSGSVRRRNDGGQAADLDLRVGTGEADCATATATIRIGPGVTG